MALRKPSGTTGNSDHHSNIHADVVGIYHEDRVHGYDDDCASNRIDWNWDPCCVGSVAQDKDQDNGQERRWDVQDLSSGDITVKIVKRSQPKP